MHQTEPGWLVYSSKKNSAINETFSSTYKMFIIMWKIPKNMKMLLVLYNKILSLLVFLCNDHSIAFVC